MRQLRDSVAGWRVWREPIRQLRDTTEFALLRASSMGWRLRRSSQRNLRVADPVGDHAASGLNNRGQAGGFCEGGLGAQAGSHICAMARLGAVTGRLS